MTLAFRITPVELTTRNIDRVTTFQSDHCRTDSRTAFRAYLPVEISVSGLPDRIRFFRNSTVIGNFAIDLGVCAKFQVCIYYTDSKLNTRPDGHSCPVLLLLFYA